MKNILSKLPPNLVKKLSYDSNKINEITLRNNKKVVIKSSDTYCDVDYVITASEVSECFQKMCNMSVYAYLDELKCGFITVSGGHRVGICGTAVMENGVIKNIKSINSLNIRMAHEVIGCADKLNFMIKNLLIVSPPGCGKTTLLRDICRKIGANNKISIVDERGEIAGVYDGTPLFDVGRMSDVMSLCDKRISMEIMLRSMSPDYIVTDEIALQDAELLKKAMSFGVNIIATAHGNDVDNTLSRIGLNKNMFDNIILLSNKCGIGTIDKIYYGGTSLC